MNSIYKWKYKTGNNFSDILLISDGIYLTGLFFENSKDDLSKDNDYEEKLIPVFNETIKWLDIYFSGRRPDFTPKYKINNLTDFRKKVLREVSKIPYGKTASYRDIALKINKKMSSQAVGGAVGWNPICIIIPCHRVIGKDGNLIGYGGGLSNKKELLKLEKIIK